MEIYTPGIDANYQAQIEVEAAKMGLKNPAHELILTEAQVRGMGIDPSCPLPVEGNDLKTYDFANYFIHIPDGCEIPGIPFVTKFAEANNIQLTSLQIKNLERALDPDGKGYIWKNGDGNIALERGVLAGQEKEDPVELSVTNPDFSQTTLKATPGKVIEIINEVAITTDAVEPAAGNTQTADNETLQPPVTGAGVKASVNLPAIQQPGVVMPTPQPSASPEEVQAYNTRLNNLKTILKWMASIGGIGFFGFVLAAFRSKKGERSNQSLKPAEKDESLISKRVFKNPKPLPLDESMVGATIENPTRGIIVQGGAIHAKGFDPKGIQNAQKRDEIALEIAGNPNKYPTGRGGRISLPTARAAIQAVEERKKE